MIKLKNILAENMRRFHTKNLREQDDSDYKVSQEQTKLKNIVDKLVTKMRSLSEHQIDMISDEDASDGTVEYKIKTTILWHSKQGRKKRSGFIKPMMRLYIDAIKDETGKYVNVETGKLYIEFYDNTNTVYGARRAESHTFEVLDIGVGMFGKTDDSIVDEIINLPGVQRLFF